MRLRRSNEYSRMRARDVIAVGTLGFRARRFRTALSALGIAIGVAAMVGVLGLSESSRSDLLDKISALGTNMLTVEGSSGLGDGELPESAPWAVDRIPTVERVASVYAVDATVRRNAFIDDGRGQGLSVVGVSGPLLETVGTTTALGEYPDRMDSDYPVAVVGSVAAERLGLTSLDQATYIRLDDQDVQVVAILNSFDLAADLDRSILLPRPAAVEYFDGDEFPSKVYVRIDDGEVSRTRDLLAGTAYPEHPDEVAVSRPSDALEAQAAAENAFAQLFLGLGAVALLVGGVGIANVMIIAVIERRGEIGLRRALGATTAHIRRQFVVESVMLSALGGAAGVAIGVVVTWGYASRRGWRTIIPVEAIVGGFVAAVLIGVIAGLYPAMRAARLSPTEALRT